MEGRFGDNLPPVGGKRFVETDGEGCSGNGDSDGALGPNRKQRDAA